MAKEVSTGIRAFVKDSLNQYYKRFQVKLDDNPSKNSNKSAIKINNDGSIYVYDIGNYTGSVFDDASTLQEVIKSIGQEHGMHIEAGDNIQVVSTETTNTISALGYTYNQEKNSFAELNSNTATGSYSHAEGYNTKAINPAEHAEGKFNQSHNGKTIHSIGIGSNNQTRKNAIEITQDGSIYVYGLGNYDGSTLMNTSTLQDICNSKADKIINASEGHFTSLDADGNLQDSGKKPADFALANHSHSTIIDATTESNISIDEGTINIVVEGGGFGGETEINANNIGNLHRALKDPAAPESDGNKLITNGQVFDAINKINSINQADIDNEQEACLSAIAEDDDIYFNFTLKNGNIEKHAMITLSKMDNFNRALVTPSSIPENDATKLITSKAVYNAIATRAPYYGSTISIESDGNGNLPISVGGNIERDLNDFVSNTEADKLYNIIVDFYKPNTYGHSYPGIVYWGISSQDDTVVHIYVGDYCFMATKPYESTYWENEEFDKFKISSFLETF